MVVGLGCKVQALGSRVPTPELVPTPSDDASRSVSKLLEFRVMMPEVASVSFVFVCVYFVNIVV